MLGDGMVSFGVACATDFRNAKSSPKMHLSSVELALDVQGSGGEFDHALIIAELHFHVVLHLGRAAHLVEEIHVPGSAAELAVGDPFQAQIFLPADNVADGLVFNAAQVGFADAAVLFIFASFEQLWRAKQAADMVGAEGWSFGLNHRFQLTRFRAATVRETV